MNQELTAKQPRATKWTRVATGDRGGGLWERRGVRVISTLDWAKLPQRSDTGPQWHISVSNGGKYRPTPNEVARALRDFDMVDAEEDNHHPGVARHFWMPVDPAHRVDCECKDDEVEVVEADGYRWSNDASECRGCELERALPQRRCPLHRLPAQPPGVAPRADDDSARRSCTASDQEPGASSAEVGS